jgi:hypothetical protein
MQITWVSCHDPAADINRRCTWIGATRQIVVTGLPPHFAAEAPRSFELPAAATIHDVPHDGDGFDLARQLGGVLFTMHANGQPPARDQRDRPPARNQRDTSAASANRFRRSYEARLDDNALAEQQRRLDEAMLEQIGSVPRRVSEIFTDTRGSFGRVGTRQLFEAFARLRAAGHVALVDEGYVRAPS